MSEDIRYMEESYQFSVKITKKQSEILVMMKEIDKLSRNTNDDYKYIRMNVCNSQLRKLTRELNIIRKKFTKFKEN